MKRRLTKGSTIFNLFLFLIFFLFAIVQLNDPDPYAWFTIYLVTSILCAVSVFRKIPPPLLFGFVLVLIFYAAMHIEFAIEWFYSEDKGELFGGMKQEKPYLEGTREFLGLLIALLSLFYLIRQNQTTETK